MDLLDRLADKLTVDDGCWLWTAACTGNGYGQVRHDGRLQLAHRVVYELLVGPIPEGMQLDHLCRVRRCVRPSHLEVVTQRENIMRGEGIAPAFARRDHCANGHPFTGDNVRLRPGHGRVCRACQREGKQRFLRRRRHAS